MYRLPSLARYAAGSIASYPRETHGEQTTAFEPGVYVPEGLREVATPMQCTLRDSD